MYITRVTKCRDYSVYFEDGSVSPQYITSAVCTDFLVDYPVPPQYNYYYMYRNLLMYLYTDTRNCCFVFYTIDLTRSGEY